MFPSATLYDAAMGRRLRIAYQGPRDPIPPQLRTLGDFLADPKHQIHACCIFCGYHQVVDLGRLARRRGNDFMIADLRWDRFRCTRCGLNGAMVFYGYDAPVPLPWRGER
jgi:hypothetical protein